MDREDPKAAEEVRALLKGLKKAPLEPSPYLKTRVLAELREQPSLQSFFWGNLRVLRTTVAVLGTLAAVALFGIWQSTARSVEQALAFEPVAVRLDLKGLESTSIAKARVELPEGVEFYSKRFPAIREQSSIQLAISRTAAALPSIVVRSGETGVKVLHVKFLNSENAVVAERVLKIRFSADSRGTV